VEVAVRLQLLAFGIIEVEGIRYEHDVVIDGGSARRRRKGPSKPMRDRFGHTPLSIDEDLPWSGTRLVVGTGDSGQLPVMEEVAAEARRRAVELVVLPTREACALLADVTPADVYAVLHVTC
jgi:hypothetical protein